MQNSVLIFNETEEKIEKDILCFLPIQNLSLSL